MKRLAHSIAAGLTVIPGSRVQDSDLRGEHDDSSLLAFALSNQPLAAVTLNLLARRRLARRNSFIAVPRHWTLRSAAAGILRYDESLPLPDTPAARKSHNNWLVVENACFAADFDRRLLLRTLERLDCDILAVNVVTELRASYEKVLTDSRNCLAGFRMLYEDRLEPGRLETQNSKLKTQNWPHYLFIRTAVLDVLGLRDEQRGCSLPADFDRLVENFRSRSLTLRAVKIGGRVLDLTTEQGLLAWLAENLGALRGTHYAARKPVRAGSVKIGDGASIFGKVLFGRDVRIGAGAVIAGPAILCNGVEIGDGAAISSSVIGSQITVPPGQLVEGRMIKTQNSKLKTQIRNTRYALRSTPDGGNPKSEIRNTKVFRSWPAFSYAGCLKRIADISAAIIVLLLFLPIFPVLALAIKLTSRGPVFFKDTRQGLHGSLFKCLKFRTMQAGADKMQDRLRIINLADGPQFRLKDDPRLNPVGSFLRDTYLDEVPQFLNVLLGQMSVVGPRPSPEQENVLCPSWRDARLSVRPGITGLWQVCRTRRPGRDFQEWIFYDVKYVRELSLRLDVRICRQTAKKMLAKFVERF